MSVQGVDYPACFDSREQYDEWKVSARICGQSCSICDDCTYLYRHQMLRQGRCNSANDLWVYVKRSTKEAA